MKKVIITKQKSENVVFTNSLADLMDEYQYIGFEEALRKKRYFIVTEGSARGYAVHPAGTFTSKNRQFENQTEGYFVFNSEKELYDWMLQTI
jgi:hypothetical protein